MPSDCLQFFSQYLKGSLRNRDNATSRTTSTKLFLYFTHKSRGTLKLFTLFVSVKNTKKLNLGQYWQ